MNVIQVNKIEELKKILISEKNTYLYGAGKFAKIILGKIKKEYIKGVIVTFKGGEKIFCDLPIYSIDEIVNEKDINIILGLSDDNISQVINKLDNMKISKVVRILDIESWETGKHSLRRRPILEITAKMGCSIQCRYCPQELLYSEYFKNNKKRKSELTYEEYVKCIDKTPQDTLISFAGFVEPFLHKDAAKMIRYAHESGREVSLFTTLVGMNREDFEEIKDIPFRMFVLHVPDENNFAKIPITEEYIYVLNKVLDCKKDDGTSLISGANSQSKPSEEFLQIAQGRIGVISEELHDRAGNLDGDNLRKVSPIKGPIYCGGSYELNRWVLLPDGTVVLCCMDFGLKYQLGNLLIKDYKQIKESYEYKKIFQKLREYDNDIICRKCTFARKCTEYTPVRLG